MNRKISTNLLTNTAKLISEDYMSWLQQYQLISPVEVERRRIDALGAKNLVRMLLGFFVSPRLGGTESIYIFEGLRNKEYMKLFHPASVVVVGSHLERDYANSHGYSFCWSFPITSSIHAKMYKNVDVYLIHQLNIWIIKLKNYKQVVFFLYEDTQPVGVFFVHLGKILHCSVKSICIQHGFFADKTYELRCEGQLSDINFVWDYSQAEAIGCDQSATYEIGLSYNATAKPTSEKIVILVGTGLVYDGNDDYDKSLTFFSFIHDELIKDATIKVFYRPHPNEWVHIKLIEELNKRFTLLDDFDKVKRLNGSKAIFIGTISSFLYEAGVAGHLVAYLKIYEKATPRFHFDFACEPLNINSLIDWIKNISSIEYSNSQHQILNEHSSLERFISALHAAKLVDNSDLRN